MNKKDLLAMRPLRATAKMMEAERDDIPREVPDLYGGPYRRYCQFARCRVEDGILRVALFFPDNLHTGGRRPSYEVFIDRAAEKYITYDRMADKWRTARLDNLDWPRHIRYTDGTWMSPADTKMVQRYLGGDRGGYYGVLDYQEKLLEERLERRHKKVTDAWDADLSPTRPVPKDWDRWVDKVGIPQNYIFYHYKKGGAKEGYCTYCGKNVPLTVRPRYNLEGRCPVCRRKVIYKSVGKLVRLHTGWNCVYLLQPRPDGFIVREFWAARFYTKDAWETPEIVCLEQLRTIYDGQLNPRTYFWDDYKHRGFRWVQGMPNPSWYSPQASYYCHGDRPGRVYGKGLSQLLQAKLDGTGITRFLHGNLSFMNPNDYLYERKMECFQEQLSKANLPRLASECLRNDRTLAKAFQGGIRGGLTKALCLDTHRLGRLRRNDGGMAFLAWLRWEKEQDTVLDDTVIGRFCKWGIGPADLTFILDRMSPLQAHNYLRRQAKESGEKVQQVLITWKDYLSMAMRFHLDVSNEIVFRAGKLRQRHDELVLRCKQIDKQAQAANVLKRFPKVDQVCHSIKAKYEYANEEYAIVAPTGVLDIIVEGDMLGHCLRGSDRYWDRIETHESYILFLRRTSALDTPYYTLEIEPDGTVRQLRTYHDDQNDDIHKARSFLREWQTVVAKRLTEKDRQDTAVSRVLREQEFEQLRRDSVIIFTGNLAGRKLVDVLTADLMENAA